MTSFNRDPDANHYVEHCLGELATTENEGDDSMKEEEGILILYKDERDDYIIHVGQKISDSFFLIFSLPFDDIKGVFGSKVSNKLALSTQVEIQVTAELL